MAGAFSGHLLEAFNNAPAPPSVVTSGAMSFDARAHGAPSVPPFFSPSPMAHSSFGFPPLSEDSATARQIATLQAKLDKKLGPEYISQRPGPGGGPKLTYAEGWKIINLANEVFGFNGWSSSVVNLSTDFIDYSEESKRFNIGVTAIVRVTLRDGVYHEDVGYGMLENGKSKAGALDKCKKEAITDALKRTLRNFGNLLGNCLYDKAYAQEVVKIKVPPAKFDKNELYRRPEFAERTPNPQTPAPHGQPAVSEGSSTRRDESRVKVEHEGHQPETPIMHIPRHLRQEMATSAQHAQAETPTRALATAPQKSPYRASTSGSGAIATPANRVPLTHGALATPIQTPVHAQRPPPPRAPPPQAVATSPLARARSVPERSVSFAEPLPVPPRTGSTAAADQDVANDGHGHRDGDDEDSFPLSTQDDAFFATVDLGEGDLGRPTDFDEDMGGVSVIDASVLKPGVNSAGQLSVMPPQPQVCDPAGSGSNVGPPTGEHPKMSARHEAQAQLAAKPPSTSSDGNSNTNPFYKASMSRGQQWQQHRSGSLNTASASSTSAGPAAQDIKRPLPAVSPMGGFHFPPDVKPPPEHTHPSKPVVSTSARTTMSNTSQAGSSGLKRSVDVMMAVSTAASSTRPPLIQGMGLAQRQQQQQYVNVRRPPDHSEGNDPKRLKR